MKVLFLTICYYFNSLSLRIFSSKYDQKKISRGLKERPYVIRVLVFCCFLVYAMKGKNFQICPTPVMFYLEKGLPRDSFMHCLKSFSERSAPWRIDISNLFRSITSCLHHVSSSCASSWFKLA